MLIFRGGAVARHDLSPSELQAHVEKWYRWSDELARQGRGNAGTALDNPGAAVRGHERVVTDGPYAESKEQMGGFWVIDVAEDTDQRRRAAADLAPEDGGQILAHISSLTPSRTSRFSLGSDGARWGVRTPRPPCRPTRGRQ